MGLIRGVGSLFPCPRCLIPEAQLGDLSAKAPLRTTANTMATIQEARAEWYKKDRKDKLKAARLRDVDVHLRFYYSHFVSPPTTPNGR